MQFFFILRKKNSQISFLHVYHFIITIMFFKKDVKLPWKLVTETYEYRMDNPLFAWFFHLFNWIMLIRGISPFQFFFILRKKNSQISFLHEYNHFNTLKKRCEIKFKMKKKVKTYSYLWYLIFYSASSSYVRRTAKTRSFTFIITPACRLFGGLVPGWFPVVHVSRNNKLFIIKDM